eukprot:TRINITY_DN1362_c0_g1_i1.p1 TRINITY_DN1362_c0_g1~~TRINITY_DN1362_c0_g1_i1.p1  ORF type:complete len:312 (+),score=80.82 TRINITY_DN1362_c0_g1_i1:32-937(+)
MKTTFTILFLAFIIGVHSYIQAPSIDQCSIKCANHQDCGGLCGKCGDAGQCVPIDEHMEFSMYYMTTPLFKSLFPGSAVFLKGIESLHAAIGFVYNDSVSYCLEFLPNTIINSLFPNDPSNPNFDLSAEVVHDFYIKNEFRQKTFLTKIGWKSFLELFNKKFEEFAPYYNLMDISIQGNTIISSHNGQDFALAVLEAGKELDFKYAVDYVYLDKLSLLGSTFEELSLTNVRDLSIAVDYYTAVEDAFDTNTFINVIENITENVSHGRMVCVFYSNTLKKNIYVALVPEFPVIDNSSIQSFI